MPNPLPFSRNRRAGLLCGLLGVAGMRSAAAQQPTLPPAPLPLAAMPPAPSPVGAAPAAQQESPGSGPAAAAAENTRPPGWNLGPMLTLAAGADGSIDLKERLPDGMQRGGVFSVAAGGAPLPRGVTLTPQGLLTVAHTAAVGSITGVVFAYEVD